MFDANQFGATQIKAQERNPDAGRSDQADRVCQNRQGARYLRDLSIFDGGSRVGAIRVTVSAHETAGSQLSTRLRKEWNATKIMKELERINPRFFPDAINIVPSADEDTAGRFISVGDDYLSREFAAEMYNLCGSVLHASNKPLVREVVSDRYAKAKRFDLEVRRLLETFEIDVNGEDFMVPGHLELEIDGPPKLFSASFGN